MPPTRSHRAHRLAGRPLTLAYAAPEQVLALPIGVTADVYALGVMLFELVDRGTAVSGHESARTRSRAAQGRPARSQRSGHRQAARQAAEGRSGRDRRALR